MSQRLFYCTGGLTYNTYSNPIALIVFSHFCQEYFLLLNFYISSCIQILYVLCSKQFANKSVYSHNEFLCLWNISLSSLVCASSIKFVHFLCIRIVISCPISSILVISKSSSNLPVLGIYQ